MKDKSGNILLNINSKKEKFKIYFICFKVLGYLWIRIFSWNWIYRLKPTLITN